MVLIYFHDIQSENCSNDIKLYKGTLKEEENFLGTSCDNISGVFDYVTIDFSMVDPSTQMIEFHFRETGEQGAS